MASPRSIERRIESIESGQQATRNDLDDDLDLSLTTGEKELLEEHFDVTPPTMVEP